MSGLIYTPKLMNGVFVTSADDISYSVYTRAVFALLFITSSTFYFPLLCASFEKLVLTPYNDGKC